MDERRSTDPGNDINEYLLGAQKVKLRDRILLSPYTKFLLPSLILSLVVPVTVYVIMISPYITDSMFSVTTCNLKPEYHVDCLPGKNSTEFECIEKLCCWSEALELCYHSVPSQHGYSPEGGVYYEGGVLTPREKNSPLGSPNAGEVYLDITAADGNHVEISIGTSPEISRRRVRRELEDSFFERSNLVAEEVSDEEDEITRKLLYFLPRDRSRRTVEIQLDGSTSLNAYVHYPEFSVTVARDDFTINEGSSIFSSARGPLIFTETYWEWTFYLTNGSLYGLNDLELNGTTNSIYNNENGTIIPAFLAISPSGEGAAYYVDYKGPLEVQVLNVSNLVILRGMSLPEKLVVHVFAGPTPLEAVQQLTLALASSEESPSMISPPYNYGLHVCPNEDFDSVEKTIAELNETIASLASFFAPWDSHCLNEKLAPVLNHFLTTNDLEYVKEGKILLEESGRSFSPHLSPMVLEDKGTLHLGLEDSGLLLTNGSTPYVGLYQALPVVYPDWENSGVKTMATSYLTDYLYETGSSGSIWLRDAWPKDEPELNSSSGTRADFTLFDYMPEALEIAMNNLTVPYNLLSKSGGSHHERHNSYSQGFRDLVRSLIPAIEFSGPNGESGNTSWSGLRRSVRSAVGAGIAGQLPPPNYVCGTGEFDASIHDELCARWYQAAVTWPYAIVLPDRLPGGTYLSTSASLTAARALRLRASLSTYQHTVTARFFQLGSPVLAPTSLHFPEDGLLAHSWDQFMWGDAILVGLVTLPGVSQVPIRLPGDIPWRHMMGGSEVTPITNGTIPVTTNVGELITLVRPGHMVPIHTEVGDTTIRTISSNVTLLVNLNCGEEEEEKEEEASCSASGEIYYGLVEGYFLTIGVNRTHLTLGNVNNVRIYACDDSEEIVSQGTIIQTVELLGTSSYEINTELCDLQENNVYISLT